MFGDKGIELDKWVKGGKWDKIEKKFLNSSDENRLLLAKSLGVAPADESYNLLVNLIKDENHDVQLAAIKSLGESASERAIAQLQWVLAKTPETSKDTIDAIQAAINNVRCKKR